MDKRLHFLSNIRYFEAAARWESYSRAAQELCVTQAAVSQKLRQLEEALGCKLFIRQGRDMVLTGEGQRLYTKVSSAFETLIEGLNATQPEPIEGVLSVATSPSFAARWLMPRLWKFSLEYPETLIRISSAMAPKVALTSEIDVAIGEVNFHEEGIVREMLFNEAVFPVCSPSLARDMKLTHPEQLLKCWLIKGIRSHHFSWESWFAKANVDISQRACEWMEVDTLDMGINAVIAGHGVCPGTDSLAGDFIERGLLVKPFDIELDNGIEYVASYHSNSIRKARISVFVQWLKREALQHANLFENR
ncbi:MULTISPECIES: LysR substrate-binding domain-containing protein [Vibrio]|uniref:LysR family transcriptional regulator n=1 Tax=Vibrio neptunius TaxID=170651 RepID=A0ABS3A4G7_9VIBR|nr:MULTISPECIES: LysR substrate-binding domain-containing protein [Vibrio]KJY93588.1 LysR family transcriptional regulator [Vibrio neptunius]MBN3494485.1 LysR family transcriptional regulator [Vibrio neptunius]MBN3516958.1 LysR family transcriptional regulator [Vibrio neptunius]MBN3551330.1 LysR family transcriptional regulator [Vibrio neptunius]MBN3579355.1 LysR family transcriptional regulator [Vibrio neptunius]